MSQRTGASRRKPVVTRKVVDSEEEENVSLEEMDTASQPSSQANSPAPQPSTTNDTNDKDEIPLDEDGNPILPEGTVMVQPEAVEDESNEFTGPEFRKKRKPKSKTPKSSTTGTPGQGEANLEDSVNCTACWKQVNPWKKDCIKRHPVLKVLLCRKCYNYYTSDEFDQDSNGMDEQCRWCGEGGRLLCCDHCSNAFCKVCIKRNLGRADLSNILDAGDDDKWACYVCDPKPLSGLIEACNAIFDKVGKKAAAAAQAAKKEKTKQEAPKGPAPKPSRGRPRNPTDSGAKPDAQHPASNGLDLNVNEDNVDIAVNLLLEPAQGVVRTLLSLQKDLVTVSKQRRDGKLSTEDNACSLSMRKIAVAQFKSSWSRYQTNMSSVQGSLKKVHSKPHPVAVVPAGFTNVASKSVSTQEPKADKLDFKITKNFDSDDDDVIVLDDDSPPRDKKKKTQSSENMCTNGNCGTDDEDVKVAVVKDENGVSAAEEEICDDKKGGKKSVRRSLQLDDPKEKIKTAKNADDGKKSSNNGTREQKHEKGKDNSHNKLSLSRSKSRSNNKDEKLKSSDETKAGGSNEKKGKSNRDEKSKVTSEKRKMSDEEDKSQEEDNPEHSSEDEKEISFNIKNSKTKKRDEDSAENSEEDSKMDDKKDVMKKGSDLKGKNLKSASSSQDDLSDNEKEASARGKKSGRGKAETEASENTQDREEMEEEDKNTKKTNNQKGTKMEDASSQDGASESDAEPMDVDSLPDISLPPSDEDTSNPAPSLAADEKAEDEEDTSTTTNRRASRSKSSKKQKADEDDEEKDTTTSTSRRSARSTSKSSQKEKDDEEEEEDEEKDTSTSTSRRSARSTSKSSQKEKADEEEDEDDEEKDTSTATSRRSARSTSKSSQKEKADEEEEDEEKDTSTSTSRRSARNKSPEKQKADEDEEEEEDENDKDAETKKTPVKGKRGMKVTPRKIRSRDNIEAQRVLHREMIDESSDEDGDNDKDDDDYDESEEEEDVLEESDSVTEESSGEEFSLKNAISGGGGGGGAKSGPKRRGRKKETRGRKKIERVFGMKLGKAGKKGREDSEDESESDSDSEEDKKKKKTKKSKKEESESASEESEDEKKSKKKTQKSSKKSKKEESESASEESEDEKKSKKKTQKSTKNSKSKKESEEDDESQEEKATKKSKKSSNKDKKDTEGDSKKKTNKRKSKKDDKDTFFDSDEEETDDKKTPSASESETEAPAKAQSKRSREKTSKKSVKKEKEEEDESSTEIENGNGKSGSASEDEELDKEIEKLAKKPLAQKKKKKKEADDDVDEKEEKVKEKKAPKERAKRGRKAKKAEDDDDEEDEKSSSDDKEDSGRDVVDEAEEEEEGEDKEDRSDIEEKVAKIKSKTKKDEEDENILAKKALLADMSDEELEEGESSNDDDNEEEEDSKKSDKKQAKKASKEDDEDDEMEEEDEEEDEDVDSDDSDVSPKKKKQAYKSKLMREKLSESDSEVDKKTKGKGKKKKKEESEEESDNSSSSEAPPKRRRKRKKKSESSEEESEDNSSEEEKKKKKGKGKKRKRIKVADDSSASGGDGGDGSDSDTANTPGKKRKKIRKMLKGSKLSKDTKDAAQAEKDRRKRVADKQREFNLVQVDDANSPTKAKMTTKLVLEADDDQDPIIEVDTGLIKKLKPHQVEAVQFIWDCTCESLEMMKEDEGSGCILAHCMGLGKTLTLITFIHTMMAHAKKTKLKTCMVVCPLNTVLNWNNEFEKWIDEDMAEIDVYELASVKNKEQRADVLSMWHEGGGVMILGYEMFRNLSQCKHVRNKKLKKIYQQTLLEPGPDLVVCDEGHILKNDASALSKAMSMVKTRRRVVLTGTPLQNNLIEYHCMVQFVKPNLLGTRKEFANRFVNPITNGACADSTGQDVKVMKRRAHILHDMLDGCVQRKDYTALTKFLPPKHEYVVSVRLAKVQMTLYEKYLERISSGQETTTLGRGGRLFQDYQNLMRIWTHPWVLRLDEIRQENKRTYDTDDSFLDDDSQSGSDDDVVNLDTDGEEVETKSKGEIKKSGSESASGSGSGSASDKDSDKDEIVKKYKTRSRGGDGASTSRSSRAEAKESEEDERAFSTKWWADYMTEDDARKVELGGKLVLLFETLRMAEEIGDKVLVFSQSLLSLDLIEDFLNYIDGTAQDEENKQYAGVGSWTQGSDYFRMDGSTNPHMRKRWAEIFNDPENYRARLFLISTKAGSLGTNLVGANRVIIFDASWNPSHDVQALFRVYRFGQTKPVYIYRFVAQGTMEEKIYERQVTKQSLSQRVVDEHQIERHFNLADLQELYQFTPDRLDDPDREEKPVPIVPKDLLLAEMLTSQKDWIVTYHEHDCLLENKIEEQLSEEERKAAWEDYENEKKGAIRSSQNYLQQMQWQAQLQQMQQMQAAQQQGYQGVMMGNQRIGTYTPPSNVDLSSAVRLLLQQNPGMPVQELTARLQAMQRYHMQREAELQKQQGSMGFPMTQRQEAEAQMARIQQMRYQEARISQFGSLQDALTSQHRPSTSAYQYPSQRSAPTIVELDDD